ncbi:MAG: hypothetical protein AAFW00_01520 [Bacteroidota bacterium]
MAMRITTLTHKWFDRIFKPHYKHQLERVIIGLALLGFFIHLGLILIFDFESGTLGIHSELLVNPISAVYTPFSFILIFEVFLLVYYLPSSFTTAIGKQYEIISLIVLRRIFKDIAKVESNYTGNKVEEVVPSTTDTGVWDKSMAFLSNTKNLDLAADMIGVVVIFYLIFLFYKLMRTRPRIPASPRYSRFITLKKFSTLILLPFLIILSAIAFGEWLIEISQFNQGIIKDLSDINNVFYEDFFLILILVDVVLLIISLNFTDRYSVLIRNAGFVVSTVLIRLSFTFDGWISTLLIIFGVGFGVMIHALYNMLGHQELEVMAEEAKREANQKGDTVEEI